MEVLRFAAKKKMQLQRHVLKLLKETYSMEKEDLMSAELEIVPAGKARDCGLDREYGDRHTVRMTESAHSLP